MFVPQGFLFGNGYSYNTPYQYNNLYSVPVEHCVQTSIRRLCRLELKLLYRNRCLQTDDDDRVIT